MLLTFDIETTGSDDEAIKAIVAETVRPPKTLKKAESIKKWMDEEYPASLQDAYDRMGLDGAYGRIAVIGYSIDDDPPTSVCADNEATIIRSFFELVEERLKDDHYDKPVKPVKLVTFNGHSFDMPFLKKRCIVNGVPRPAWLPWNVKPWEPEKHFDVMRQWDDDPTKRISLDRLCRVLGIPTPKDGIDGSMVGQMVRDGRIAEVAEYCRRDITATRECFKRMTT